VVSDILTSHDASHKKAPLAEGGRQMRQKRA